MLQLKRRCMIAVVVMVLELPLDVPANMEEGMIGDADNFSQLMKSISILYRR